MCNRPVFAHSHPAAAAVVVGGHHPGGEVLLVVLVDVEDGLAALGLLHPAAVTVVDEAGGGVVKYLAMACTLRQNALFLITV